MGGSIMVKKGHFRADFSYKSRLSDWPENIDGWCLPYRKSLILNSTLLVMSLISQREVIPVYQPMVPITRRT
jgi:hypothetical protein